MAALGFLALRFLTPATGFYLDDWTMLEELVAGKTFLQSMAAAAGRLAMRPVEIVAVPAFYVLSLSTACRALLFLLLEACEAALAYLFLREATDEPVPAALAAFGLVLYPGRPVLHLWVAAAPQLLAHVLVLGSLLCHGRWRRTGRRPWLVAGQCAFLLSVLTYESTAFAPLILVALRRARGDSWAASWRAAAPYAATLAAALAWQRLGAPWAGTPNPRAVAASATHFLQTFFLGFGELTWSMAAIWAKTLRSAAGQLGFWRWSALALFAAASGAALSRCTRGARFSGRVWLAAAAGCFAAAYLPYALSADYLPSSLGVLSRANGMGAWAFGALFAALAARWPRPWALGAVVLACGWAQAQHRADYALASAAQRRVLDDVERALATAPRAKTVLLAGPLHVGEAVVFGARYDLSSALRLRTGRASLDANVLTSQVSFLSSGVIERRGAAAPTRHPYDELYLYDPLKRQLFSVEAPAGSGPPRLLLQWPK